MIALAKSSKNIQSVFLILKKCCYLLAGVDFLEKQLRIHGEDVREGAPRPLQLNYNFQLNRLANIFRKVRTPHVTDCCVPGKPNQISGLALPSPSRLMLWDTAGQEEFDAITKAYYR
jgi:hypothetical protein